MSEKLGSQSNHLAPDERVAAIDSIKDLIKVSKTGNAHVPKSSRRPEDTTRHRTGDFMSDHEISMVNAHQDQIRDGLENRDDEDEAEVPSVEVEETPAESVETAEMLEMKAELEQLKAENAELKQQLAAVLGKLDELLSKSNNSNETSSDDTPASDDSEAAITPKTERTPDEEANGVADTNDLAELQRIFAAEDARAAHVPGHRRAGETPTADVVADEQTEAGGVAREDESLEEYEARQPGRHRGEPRSNDRMLAIANGEPFEEDNDTPASLRPEWSGEPRSNDRMLAIANGESPASPRSRRQRARDVLRNPGVALSAEASAWAATRAERAEARGPQSKTRRRLGKAGLVLIGAGIGAGATYLRFHGHSGGGHGGSVPQEVVPGTHLSGKGDNGVLDQLQTIRVNKGDGEIKVTQHILDQAGIHVSAADAQRIGEHAHTDLLVGDHNYDDVNSTLNRIGGSPGVYKVRPKALEALAKSAKALGFIK